jgi:hypothetical protein
MTMNEFDSECTSRTIDPQIALENADVVDALQSRSDDRVRQLLDTEF